MFSVNIYSNISHLIPPSFLCIASQKHLKERKHHAKQSKYISINYNTCDVKNKGCNGRHL